MSPWGERNSGWCGDLKGWMIVVAVVLVVVSICGRVGDDGCVICWRYWLQLLNILLL